jgi:hypothetical protein
MSHPSRTKTQGGDRFSRNRPFSAQGRNLWAGWSDSPAQKLLARSWTGPEIFIKILSFHQKLFNFLIRTDRQTHRHTDTQTHRQTDTRTPIHIRAGEIFLCLFLIPFHFTTFASLTPFVKDNNFYCDNTVMHMIKHYITLQRRELTWKLDKAFVL